MSARDETKKGQNQMSLTDNYIFDLDENVTRKSVSYKNRFGITISADLYRPKDVDESQEHPRDHHDRLRRGHRPDRPRVR
jgi:hypothetical protein